MSGAVIEGSNRHVCSSFNFHITLCRTLWVLIADWPLLTRNSSLCPESSQTGLPSRLSDPGFEWAPHTATETLHSLHVHTTSPNTLCCLSGAVRSKLNLLSPHTPIRKSEAVKLAHKLKKRLTILSLKYLSSYLLSVNHLCFQFYKNVWKWMCVKYHLSSTWNWFDDSKITF